MHGRVDNILPVLKQDEFDEYIFAGDLFGYFQGGENVIKLINKYKVKFILGNHDLYFLREISPKWFSMRFPEEEKRMLKPKEYDQRYGYLFNSLAEIRKFDFSFFQNADLSGRISIDNLDILICHGSPQDPFNEYIYPDYDYFDEIFDNNIFDILILGHTHKSFIKTKGNRYIINPGSCTLPRDNAAPSYVVFDSNAGTPVISELSQRLHYTRITKSKLILN